jgi:hypothetical protein
MSATLQSLLRSFRAAYSSRRTEVPIAFSELVSSIYTETMSYLDARLGSKSYRERYANHNPRPDQITSEADVAGELWCFFPTHFFKFHNMLVETALPASGDELVQSIFGCGRLTLLDIGAGVGTAALATIDILHEWQRFLLQAGLTPYPVELTVQPIETNPVKLPILQRMLQLASQKVTPYFLQIHIRPPITARYPEEACLAEIAGAIRDGGPQLFVALSNILTWIEPWRPAPEGVLARLWDRLVRVFKSPQTPPYLLATAQFLNGLKFDVKTIALVETDGRDGRLSRAVDNATRALAVHLKGTEISTAGAGRIIFANPTGSNYFLWRSLK